MRIFVLIYTVAMAGFLIWWLAAMTKQAIQCHREAGDRRLEITCCFCDREMHRDQEIELGEFNQCVGCDSDIEAVKPESGSNVCRIGKWKSYYV